MHVCRYLRFYIIQSVHLDTALMLAKFGPPEHLEAQVDGCGIKGINPSIQVENLGRPLLSGHVDHVESELFKDSAVTIFVGF